MGHIGNRLAFGGICLAIVLLLDILQMLQLLITRQLLLREKSALILPRLHHGILSVGTLVYVLTVWASFNFLDVLDSCSARHLSSNTVRPMMVKCHLMVLLVMQRVLQGSARAIRFVLLLMHSYLIELVRVELIHFDFLD